MGNPGIFTGPKTGIGYPGNCKFIIGFAASPVNEK
jgi:hypothetical protein